jgi:hypothetical protein
MTTTMKAKRIETVRRIAKLRAIAGRVGAERAVEMLAAAEALEWELLSPA